MLMEWKGGVRCSMQWTNFCRQMTRPLFVQLWSALLAWRRPTSCHNFTFETSAYVLLIICRDSLKQKPLVNGTLNCMPTLPDRRIN